MSVAKLALRDFFSATAESGQTAGFKTETIGLSQNQLFKQIEHILTPEKGYVLVHKSEHYHECMLTFKKTEITLTLMHVSAKECAVGMHIMSKQRFGYPRRFGKKVYKLMKEQVAHL